MTAKLIALKMVLRLRDPKQESGELSTLCTRAPKTPSTICLAMVERLAVWGSGGQLEDTFE